MPIGNLIQRARSDARKFSLRGFSVELMLTPGYSGFTFQSGLAIPYVDDTNQLITGVDLSSADTVTIQGFAQSNRLEVDPETGLPITGKTSFAFFSEKELNTLGFGTRNQRGDCIVEGWLLSWTDNLVSRIYRIGNPRPDETIGTILCTLTDYDG